MEGKIIEILNKYQNVNPLHDEKCIDPMDFHKIAKELKQYIESEYSGQLFVYDSVNEEFEQVDSIKDGKTWILDHYAEDNDLHPDMESVSLFRKIGNFEVTETDETVERNGEIVPVCAVKFLYS